MRAALAPQRARPRAPARRGESSDAQALGREAAGRERLVLVARGDLERRRAVRRRRVAELAPPVQLLGVEALVLARRRQGDGPGFGAERLHDHAARPLAAAAAAAHLHEHGEGALLGAEVREVQREVGVDDADQRDVRESGGPWRSSACPRGPWRRARRSDRGRRAGARTTPRRPSRGAAGRRPAEQRPHLALHALGAEAVAHEVERCRTTGTRAGADSLCPQVRQRRPRRRRTA